MKAVDEHHLIDFFDTLLITLIQMLSFTATHKDKFLTAYYSCHHIKLSDMAVFYVCLLYRVVCLFITEKTSSIDTIQILRNLLVFDSDIYVVKTTLIQTVSPVQIYDVRDIMDRMATFSSIQSLSNYLYITCLHEDFPAAWELESCDSFLKSYPLFLSLSYAY